MQRVRRLVIAALLLGGSVTAAFALRAFAPVVRGDVNADGEITALDALAVLSDVVGKALPDGYTILPNGDANGDGEITAADALVVLSHTVGEDVSQFPIGEALPTTSPVASVTVAPDSSDLMVGSTLRLEATPRDSANAALADRPVTWTTSDSTLATVASDGLVTAIAIGDVTITATAEGKTGTARIRVVPASGTMSIDVSPRQSTVLVNGTVQLSAEVVDGAGNPVAGRVITWSTPDPAIATVSESGLVTGVALGTVEIQAASDALAANVTISVVAAASQANRTWTGAVSSDWSDPGNWDPAGVPIATDTLLIRAGGAPQFGGSNGMIAGLVMEPGATLDIGSNELQVSGRLDVDGTVQGTNPGRITVQGVEGKESYVRGTLPSLTINGTTVLVGPTEVDGTLEVNPASILRLNGQSVDVSQDMTIRGGLQMRERTERLDVRGTAYFFNDASTTDAELEGGTIHVGGDFTVDVATPTSKSPFPSTGEHLLVLDGSADQTVRNIGLEVLEIREMVVANPSGQITFTAAPSDRFRVRDDFDVQTAATITGDGRVNVLGDFTTAFGGAVSLRNLAVRGTLAAGSGFQPDTLTLLGRGQLVPAGDAYAYQTVVVAGSDRFVGTTGIAGSLILGCLTELSDCDGMSAALDLAGQMVTVDGDLRQTAAHPASPLYMQDPAGELTVGGSVLGPVGLPTGAVEFTVDEGDWTSGTLRVGENFHARGAGASGTHTTILNGAGEQALRIISGFHFQELQLVGDGDVVMNDTTSALGRQRVVGVRGSLGITTAVRLYGTGRMDVGGNVETVPGSSIEIGALSLSGVLRASGTLKPDTAEFNNPGTAQTIQNNPDYRTVVVRGRAVFGGSMTFAGSLIVRPDAELTVGARHVTVSRDLLVSGILRMQDARDTLTVLGDSAVFYGRNDPNVKAYATEGVLRVAGNLASDSTGFYPTRNHKVVFTGGDQRRARGVFNQFEVAATGSGRSGVVLRGLTVRRDLVTTASQGRITIDTVTVDGNALLDHPDTVMVLRSTRIEGDLTLRNLRTAEHGGLRVGGDLRLVDGARLAGYVHHRGRYIEEGEVVDPSSGRPMLEGLYYLRWVQQPTTTQAGVPFDPVVSVEVVDSAGNRLTRGSTMVTLDNPGFLSGTVRVSTVDGVATFPGVAPTTPHESARLNAATTAPNGAYGAWTSGSFVVSPAPPAPVSGGLSFSSLTAGLLHSCGVTDAGAAYCWGLGSAGRLGTGDSSDQAAPAAVDGGLAFAQISAGSAHTCALTDAGAAYCWGFNQYGNLGTGGALNDTIRSPEPVAGGLTFSTISAGYSHTCGLTDEGKAYCWGNGNQGILGDGGFTHQSAPVAVAGDYTFTAISTSGNTTCALTAAGEAYCWGLNGSGQIGDGTTTSRATPTLVSGGHTFAAISAGVEHTCAVTTEGSAYCWGDNQDGRLGDRTFVRRLVPTAVFGGITFASVDVERFHSCGLTADGTAYCWGRNASGELGDGNVDSDGVTAPVPVALDVPLVSIHTGNDHTLGLDASGTAYAWGGNRWGQLGN